MVYTYFLPGALLDAYSRTLDWTLYNLSSLADTNEENVVQTKYIAHLYMVLKYRA